MKRLFLSPGFFSWVFALLITSVLVLYALVNEDFGKSNLNFDKSDPQTAEKQLEERRKKIKRELAEKKVDLSTEQIEKIRKSLEKQKKKVLVERIEKLQQSAEDLKKINKINVETLEEKAKERFKRKVEASKKTPNTDVIIPWAAQGGHRWKYSLDKPVGKWQKKNFNDLSWKDSQGGFGQGAVKSAKFLTEWNTKELWARSAFYLKAGDLSRDLHFYLNFEDAAQVYINGTKALDLREAVHNAVFWNYSTNNPGYNWNELSYDDQDWERDLGGLGFYYEDALTRIITQFRTKRLWVRLPFEYYGKRKEAEKLLISLCAFEYGKIYLNGKEIYEIKNWESFDFANRRDYQQIEIDLSQRRYNWILKEGKNVLAFDLSTRKEEAFVNFDAGVSLYTNGGSYTLAERVEEVLLGNESFDRPSTGYELLPLSAKSISSLKEGVNTVAVYAFRSDDNQYLDLGIVEPKLDVKLLSQIENLATEIQTEVSTEEKMVKKALGDIIKKSEKLKADLESEQAENSEVETERGSWFSKNSKSETDNSNTVNDSQRRELIEKETKALTSSLNEIKKAREKNNSSQAEDPSTSEKSLVKQEDKTKKYLKSKNATTTEAKLEQLAKKVTALKEERYFEGLNSEQSDSEKDLEAFEEAAEKDALKDSRKDKKALDKMSLAQLAKQAEALDKQIKKDYSLAKVAEQALKQDRDLELKTFSNALVESTTDDKSISNINFNPKTVEELRAYKKNINNLSGKVKSMSLQAETRVYKILFDKDPNQAKSPEDGSDYNRELSEEEKLEAAKMASQGFKTKGAYGATVIDFSRLMGSTLGQDEDIDYSMSDYEGRMQRDTRSSAGTSIQLNESRVIASALPGRRYSEESEREGWLYVDSWYIIGPFENHGSYRFEDEHPPELEIDLDAHYQGKLYRGEALDLRWRFYHNPTMYVTPHRVMDNSTYYLYTEVYFDEGKEMIVAIGSDDRAVVWINELSIWEEQGRSPWALDEGFRKVYFKRGFNKILVRLENGPHRCRFSFLICPPDSGLNLL